MRVMKSFVPSVRWLGAAAALFCISVVSSGQNQVAAPKDLDPEHAAKMAKGLDLFKKHVKPLIESKCLRCHGGQKIESELDLSDRDSLVKGGLHGPAIVPGKSKDSLLIKLVGHQKEPFMPKNGAQLPPDVRAQLAAWIDLGAPYDNPLTAAKSKKRSWTEKVVEPEAKQWWAFQPLAKPAPPAVKNAAWAKSSLDRFILAKLEAAGIAPNPPAPRNVLIRRAYFDLLGLPPTPEEVDTFLNDKSPDAWPKLIDRILNSPHYGERWGRHWLDLARFAESHGFEHDSDRPTAFHYRDFVIEALNRDLPYNTFVQWQIAGDEYAPDDNLALKATGFLAAGVHSTQITKSEVEKHRYDEMDDELNTLSTAMLGLTVGCARCHDHKYDPIPARDYYRMLSTFTTTVRSEIELKPHPEEYVKAKTAFDLAHQPFVAKLTQFEKELLSARLTSWEEKKPDNLKIPAPILEILKIKGDERKAEQQSELLKWYRAIDAEWKKLDLQVQEHAKKAPLVPKMLVATEGLPPVRLHTQGDDFFKETYFLRRGDPDNKEGVAPQGFLQVLMPGPDAAKRWQMPPPDGWRTSYRRRALAEWITDVDQGAGALLARVMANRLWQHHLGRGIVATPSDFGVRGEAPTHPELLDWLARELIANGWKLKAMHKLIMTSAVYMQGSALDEAKAKVDRENKLCWRMPPRRLEAEVIRDAILAVGGQLDPKMFGPGTLDEGSKRRSIYFTVKRSKLMPMMIIFDAPEALGGMAERPTTTIAPQALHLLNNPRMRDCAKTFAQRLGSGKLPDAVQVAYRIALARNPSADEMSDGLAFVNEQMATYEGADRRERALTDFCQVLLCLNEFIYVD
jgi:Protein of unknown function (DUF1549)/Protein of unknown function (DUF1553)/Planctomycete cytochrome C